MCYNCKAIQGIQQHTIIAAAEALPQKAYSWSNWKTSQYQFFYFLQYYIGFLDETIFTSIFSRWNCSQMPELRLKICQRSQFHRFSQVTFFKEWKSWRVGLWLWVLFCFILVLFCFVFSVSNSFYLIWEGWKAETRSLSGPILTVLFKCAVTLASVLFESLLGRRWHPGSADRRIIPWCSAPKDLNAKCSFGSEAPHLLIKDWLKFWDCFVT